MNKKTITIIGLGYVGLPLAVEFAKKYKVIGFDIDKFRVNDLKNGNDSTLEVETSTLKKVLLRDLTSSAKKGLYITDKKDFISQASIFIVTVPTPTDKHMRPILTPLIKSSETVGMYLKKGDIVIYESTVYPGVTEDECVPVLEKTSNLKLIKIFL